jgi:hypothetical protein
MGPFYRVGQAPERAHAALEAHARKMWKLQPGDPYDYEYPREFLRAFLQSVDPRQFKIVRAWRPALTDR